MRRYWRYQYYVCMEETRFGQKAPLLDDGTLLLQEQFLTPSQTEAVKRDMVRFAADKRTSRREQRNYRVLSIACLIILFANMVVSLMNLSGVIQMNSIPTGAITIAALLGPIWFRNWMRDQSDKRGTGQIAAVAGEGASVPLAMVDRFLLSRRDQLQTYSDLLTDKSAVVGGMYRIVLDTGNASKYVVRVVQKPVTEAPSQEKRHGIRILST